MNTNLTDIYYRMAYATLQFGGGTFARDAFRNTVLPNRYIVAIGAPHAKVVPATVADIAKALRELSDDRGAWPAGTIRALGTWIDDGKVYVDVVESIPHVVTAKLVAMQRDQLAIFDSERQVSITV